MHQHEREPAGQVSSTLPVAITLHPAAVVGIDLNRLNHALRKEWRPGKKITDNRLQVAIAQSAPRFERREPRRWFAEG